MARGGKGAVAGGRVETGDAGGAAHTSGIALAVVEHTTRKSATWAAVRSSGGRAAPSMDTRAFWGEQQFGTVPSISVHKHARVLNVSAWTADNEVIKSQPL